MTEHSTKAVEKNESMVARGSVGREKSRFTIALICPSCGAGISFVEGSTKVTCGHCGLSHMVVGDKGLLRYYIPNRKESHEVTTRVRRFLAETRMDRGAGRTPHFVDARLAYIPFFRIKIIGGGWYIGQTVGQVVTWTQTGQQEEIAISHEARKKVIEGFFKDLVYFTPAVDISEMGLIGVWAKSLVLEIVPFDQDMPAAGQVEGEVYSAVKDPKTASREAWATLTASAKPAGMNLEYFEAERVAEQVTVIHYPVWIVRFLLGEAPRRIVIDGLGGDIIFAHIPKKERLRTIPGLITLAIVALIAVTIPAALGIPAAVLIIIVIYKGINWFLSLLDRLFINPWRHEEVIIG